MLGLVLLCQLHAQPTPTSNELLVKYQLQYYHPRLFFCIDANFCYQQIPVMRLALDHIVDAHLPVYPLFVMKHIRQPEVPSFLRRNFGTDHPPCERLIIDEKLFDLLSPSGYSGVYYLDDFGELQEIPLLNVTYSEALERMDKLFAGQRKAETVTLDESRSYIDNNVQFMPAPDGPLAINTTRQVVSVFAPSGSFIRDITIPVSYDSLLRYSIYRGNDSLYGKSRQMERVLARVGLTPSSFSSMYTGSEIFMEYWYKYAEITAIDPDTRDTNISVNGFRSLLRYTPATGAWKIRYLPLESVMLSNYRFDGLVYGDGDTVYARLTNTADHTGDKYGVYDLGGDLVNFRRFLPLPSLTYAEGEYPKWIFRTLRERPVAIEVHKAVYCDLRSGAWYRLPLPKTDQLRVYDLVYSEQTQRYYMLFFDGTYYAMQTHDDISQPAIATRFYNPAYFQQARFMLNGNRLLIFSMGIDRVLYYQQVFD